ncbi:IS110 family RNA-guided transposase [Azospirillum canadense]|uniref:IS110 family transposase n=1 Tax=Azospirillum canadense TaxID=403962 RepID=UPI002227DC40|nr:IS110 family transposase [Azospirillum canadense]MCW2240450.1 transposase [Azospirillum canadense]
MAKPDDLSKPRLTLDHGSTLVCVIEMSGSSWLVAATVPGVDRRPLQKLPVNPARLLEQVERWRGEAARAGRPITRTVVAYESGRDGFWLTRLLQGHGIEAYVIHASSVAVSREQRRAKTDRLDTEMLMRALLGWLRCEPGHCRMVAIPTIAQEDARRPGRERDGLVTDRTRLTNTIKAELALWGIRGFKPGLRKAADHVEALRTADGAPLPPNTLARLHRLLERRRLVGEQIAAIERDAAQAVERDPTGPNALVLLLAKIKGIGLETAQMLVHEVLSRNLRDRRAVARYAGLTGTPDESGSRRRDKGIGKAGNPRVRCGMIQLAWRFLMFQPDSALARWYRERTVAARGSVRKTLIVALARKLLVALWSYAAAGVVPEGVVLKAA